MSMHRPDRARGPSVCFVSLSSTPEEAAAAKDIVHDCTSATFLSPSRTRCRMAHDTPVIDPNIIAEPYAVFVDEGGAQALRVHLDIPSTPVTRYDSTYN